MSYADRVLAEFDHEVATTRKVLASVPDHLLEWKPFDSAHTIGWNANHLMEIAGWVDGILRFDEWDIAPEGAPPYVSLNLTSTAEILAQFDKNVATARKAIQEVDDSAMSVVWSLKQTGQTLLSMPREATMRTWVFSHTIHHRAILVTYLRFNGIDPPPVFGM